MQVNRTPFDALHLAADVLFVRWAHELQVIEEEFEQPKPENYELDAQAGDPRYDAWHAEMRKRDDRLHPLAAEMAIAHLRRFDPSQRNELARLLEKYRNVIWQWPGVITNYFERFLQSWALQDFEMICALIAIYDLRALSKDFSRSSYPFYHKIRQQGLDPAPLFALGLPLTTAYADPYQGAHALFVQLSTPYPDDSSTKPV